MCVEGSMAKRLAAFAPNVYDSTARKELGICNEKRSLMLYKKSQARSSVIFESRASYATYCFDSVIGRFVAGGWIMLSPPLFAISSYP